MNCAVTFYDLTEEEISRLIDDNSDDKSDIIIPDIYEKLSFGNKIRENPELTVSMNNAVTEICEIIFSEVFRDNDITSEKINKAVDDFREKVTFSSLKNTEKMVIKANILYHNKDYKKAFELYHNIAEQGIDYVQVIVGDMYYHGIGTDRDYSKSVRWYKKAAEQNSDDAQNKLGAAYMNGRGIEQNYEEALGWFRKSAEQGNAEAQNNLGCIYEKGKGVRQDYSQAVEWYKKSALQGNKEAQDNLGDMYYFGNGVEQDYKEAEKWYSMSAKHEQ